MAYSDKVVDHFNNPRNVGSLDKNDPEVGTGIVGAPECFTGDTLVATADGSKVKSLREIYENNEIIPVWSFNIEDKLFEIKLAQAVYTGPKKVDKLTFNDDSTAKVTSDHRFLLRPCYSYRENILINSDSIRPFKRYVSKRGYWRIRDTKSQYEYLDYFKFLNPQTSLRGINIHHKDHDKRNDFKSNLEAISLAEHLKEHRDDHYQGFNPKFNKQEILLALEKSTRAQAANKLDIFADEFYNHLLFFELTDTPRPKTKIEIRELASQRMRENNPYHNFTEAQKLAFAVHKGSSNGRWIDAPNEKLLWYAHLLYKFTGKLTCAHWQKFAKHLNLPQNLSSRFESWASFKEEALSYNHTIKKREQLSGLHDCFTLQVEENNNYVVITQLSKNIQEGIVVKNCGDVMRLQIKIKDNIIQEAKFKTFGCGSAIASSSLATEWIKGKTIEEANSIKNVQIVEELSLPPVKIHCSVLAEDAIKAAIKDYQSKKPKQA